MALFYVSNYLLYLKRDSSVGSDYLMSRKTEALFNSRQGQICLRTQIVQTRSCSSSSLQFNGYRGLFPVSKVARAWMPHHSIPSSLSSSSSSYICHGVGPLVDPFRSHVSRSLFKVLPCFLLPAGGLCFITRGNLFRGILFTCCIQFLLYSSDLLLCNLCICFVICPKCILLFFSYISSLLLLFFWRHLL